MAYYANLNACPTAPRNVDFKAKCAILSERTKYLLTAYKAMPKASCVYHPETDAVGFCERCGMPVCANCMTIRMSYFSRVAQKLCNFCVAKSDAKTVAILIGTFVPFVLISSLAWIFFFLSPLLGWLYMFTVPLFFVAMAFRYYRRKMAKIKASAG